MDERFRAIAPGEFARPKVSIEPGPAPMLQWVRIEDLVVDGSYQRPIYGAGRKNVSAIAAKFRWSKFAPLIVAPVAGGKFAVIDGQHRATAAALNGIEQVPAQVIIADATEQADAFRAVNGETTRVHRLTVQRAALAAGDADAKELDEVVKAAGVTVCPYPRAIDRLKPGETLSLGAIEKGLKDYGRETVITALTCVTETENNRPGVLNGPILKALFTVLGGNIAWRESGGALLAAFDEIDLEIELEEAMLTRRAKGVAAWEVLAERLKSRLREAFPKAV